MSLQVTLIGLGQIGASMGLALGANRDGLLRVGNDKKKDVEKKAIALGAIDEAIHNLPKAVSGAKIVVMCVPLNEVQETLEFIAPDLQEGAVVLDSAPVKAQTFELAKRVLPENCHFIGLVPALNPAYLMNMEPGIAAAKADLFSRSTIIIDSPPGVPESAVNLAADLVRLIGGAPLIADPAESDGLMAMVHLLPQMAAAGLLNASVDQPGWQEARKVAGRPFANVTSALVAHDDIDSLITAITQNRGNSLHALGVLVAALKGLREDIENYDNEGVAERLKGALEGYQRWLKERQAADWSETTSKSVDVPSFAERLFGTTIVKQRR